MKRISPLVLVVACVALLVAGIAWKIAGADECMDQGWTVVAPMTHGQDCVR
jgi:hypothetical protein